MSELANREKTVRQRRARPDGAHDSFVSWMLRLLPMGVGGLAAILIVTPIATAQSESSFLLAKEEVALAKERMRLTAATYRGRDGEGRPFVLTAGSAVQATSEEPVVRVTNMVAELGMTNGPARIEAQSGIYNLQTETVTVDGPMTYKSADGYQLAMSNVSVNLKTRRVQGNGAAQGSAPQGSMAGNSVNADLASKQVSIGGGVQGQHSQGNFKGGALDANLGTKQVAITGGVSGTTREGSFSGNRMDADLNTRRVAIGGGVSGSTRLGTFAGSQLEADLSARRVAVRGGVTGKTKFGTYSADTLTVDERSRTFVLQGRARLTLYPRGL